MQVRAKAWIATVRKLFDRNRKRFHRFLALALVTPIFVTVTAPTPANAFITKPSTSNDGTCSQSYNYSTSAGYTSTGIVVTQVGNDCLVTFNAIANALGTYTWVMPNGISSWQVLVVGGGGGGGGDGGHGGGGGELRYDSGPSNAPSVNTVLTIQVGNGGAAGTAGADSKITWGGVDKYIAKAGAGGAGWNTNTSAAGGTGGTGGTGTAGQSSGTAMANNACTGTLYATQDSSSGNWYSGLWFLGGGGGAVEALTTTAPTNSISGSSKYYGGAGGGGWGMNLNSANTGPIYGLPGGGTVGQISTSGGRGSNWQKEPGSSTTYRAGASAGEQGVDGTGGGGGAGAACDPTINGTALVNGVTKRTSGGRGGSGVVVIRYTPKAPTITDSSTVDTVYRNIIFTSPGSTTWTAPAGVTSADILIVGGGGGGGDSDAGNTGGGGGAGGFYELTNRAISGTVSYDVSVGAGGSGGVEDVAGIGGTGGDSLFASFVVGGGGGGGSFTSITQSGGAGVPTSLSGYIAGGSGGGASWSTTAGSGGAGGLASSSLGYTGANGFAGAGTNTVGWGGGGGGAGGAAPTGNYSGAGGAGKISSITGTTTTYAAGGSASAAAIVQNTGNGGSANYSNNTGGTDGASGVVAIRIKLISGSIGVTYPYALNMGEVLTATDTSTITAFNGATYQYQWQSAASASGPWTNIAGANSRTYTLTANDFSKYMRVAILAIDSYGTTTNGIYSTVSGLTGSCVLDKSNLNTSTAGYLLYKITSGSSCTWYAPEGTTSVDAFLVGGGGGGGADGGAGGGGGSINTVTAISLPSNKTLTVTVGAGGTGGTWGVNGVSGGTSSLSNGTTTYTAPGGSGGGGCGAAASAGGVTGSGGTPVAGGAGGKGAPGCGGATVGDPGAAGPTSSFTGTSLNYGGGGGGGIYPNSSTYLGAIAGGAGGGGASARGSANGNTQDGQPGTNGLGGGGGAGSAGNVKGPGGVGGSGVVYIKVPIVTSGTSSFSALNTVQTRSDTFSVTNALDKASTTFSVTPTIANIVMETVTASSVNTWGAVQLVARVGLTVGTYTETITATDKNGATSIKVVTITSYSALMWSDSNTATVVTTYGKPTRTRLDLSGGIGTRVAAITHMSTPAPKLVTIDTSTIASGYITLITDTATAPGSYLESITVIDGSNVRKTALVTITVNSPPDITYTAATDAEYPLVTTDLFLNYDFSNTSSYSGAGTTITDLKGNAISGTVTSASTFGLAGGGNFSLNGTNRAVIQYSPLTNTQSFSKFLWIYPTSATGSIIDVCDSLACGYHESEFEMSAGVLYARGYYTGNANSGTNTVSLNQWHYVGFTWEYSSASVSYTKIYLDGKLVGSTTNSSTRQAPTGGEYNLISVGDSTAMATTSSGTFLFGAYQLYKAAINANQVSINYSNSKPRYLGLSQTAPTISGNATFAMTEGKSATYQIFSEVGGTGTNTYSLSGTNSALSLASVGTDQTSIVVSSSITATNATTAKTYYETLTATDSASASTAYYLTITVNPKISITATTDTVTTTFGKVAYDTLTAMYGTGTLTFSRTSSSGSSAISATSTTSQSVLTIAGTLPAGTYFETFTVTDSMSATSIKVIKIVVNPMLSMAVPDGTSLTTTITKAVSRRIYLYDGTDTRTATLSVTSRDAHVGITLDQTNLQALSGGYLIVNVGTTVPANTYTYMVSVRDNLGASTSVSLTITVNKWPIIQNASAVSDNIKLSYDASVAGSATNAQWNDLSASAKNMTLSSGAIATGESTGLISFNESTTTTSYGSVSNFGSLVDTYSLETWIRISGRPTTEACIICESGSGNKNFYFFVRSSGNIGGNYYNGNWGVQTPEFPSALNTWYHVVFTVSKVGSNYYQDLYINGAKYGSTSAASTTGPASASQAYVIGKAGSSADYLKMSMPLLRLYGRALTAAEVQQNYLATVNRFTSASSGTTNLVTTAGAAVSSGQFTASDGTGTKTFSRTTSTAGLSLTSSSDNTFVLSADNTLTSVDSQTARTIYETVTATDSMSATSALAFSIIVNPPIIETATTTSLSTTSGIETSTVIYATKGSSDKTFTLTGTATSGVTLTSGTNQATLRVLSTINPGTYWETITASDTTGATSSIAVRVIVNPGPTISGRSVITSTTSTNYTSLGYYLNNGSGTLKLSMNPTIPGITLDTSTANIGYIKVASSVSTAATNYETLTVTDANGAIGTLAVTIKIVAPVALTGNTSVVSTFGDSNIFSYSATGGTSPYNIMITGTQSTCITSKSTTGAFTVEQFLGAKAGTSCTWVVPNGVTSLTGLVVAGGGQGGTGRGGGGGAGALETGTMTVAAGDLLTITVGVGGSNSSCNPANYPAGCNGTDSIIGISGNTTYVVAKGGGGGGGHSTNYDGRAGGSGGGAGMNYASVVPVAGATASNTVPSGWTAYGSAGAATIDVEGTPAGTNYRSTGGGGGAGHAGYAGTCTNASPSCDKSGTAGGATPDGGEGLAISITGTSTFYAGGGGGSVAIAVEELGTSIYTSPKPGNSNLTTAKAKAGVGGGSTNYTGTSAAANTGSGGGGSIRNAGGNGGSGIVILRYTTPTAAAATNRISFQLIDSSTGQFNMTVPESVTVGTYSQSVYVSSNTDTSSVESAFAISVTIIQDTPTATLSLPGSVLTAKYGTPVTISAATSTNGTVSFKKGAGTISGCGFIPTINGLASCTWTPNIVETTTLTAVLTPSDSINYRTSIEADSAIRVVVGKADTLTITAKSPAPITYSSPLVLPSNSFTTNGLASIDSITSISYTYGDNSATTCANGGTCSVGDIGPAGGVVFYTSASVIDSATGVSTGGIYLEAAPKPFSTTTYYWCQVGSTYYPLDFRTTSELIGKGAENTRLLNQTCTGGALYEAANLTLGGYSDWFLPSKAELDEMNKVYTQIGLVAHSSYLSSSEWVGLSGQVTTWVLDPGVTAAGWWKDQKTVMWPVRAFSPGSVSYTGIISDAGTYSINLSNAIFGPGATSNYTSIQYLPGTLIINKATRGTWSASYNAGTNATRYGVGKTETATVITSGDGAPAFSTASSTCSANATNGTLTTLGVGSCSVQVVLPQTRNWLSDTKTVTVTINRGLRTATITPALTTIKYGDTTTVVAAISPALDSATATYSNNNTLGCAIDNISGQVTGIKALTTCSVRVTYDQTTLYESATATASITVNRATAPVVTTDTITAVSYTGSTAIVNPTYKVTGILGRDILQILPTADVSSAAAISAISSTRYSAVASFQYFATNPTSYDSTTAPTLGGTYAVKAQSLTLLNGVDIGNYETPTYVASNLVINPIAQTPVVIKLAYLESVTVPFDVVAIGGSSTGTRTLNILPGGTATGCAVDSGVSAMRLKTTTSGTCVISVTQAADRNYLVATSDSQTVRILNFVVNILQLFDNPTGISINHDVPVTKGSIQCTVNCQPKITSITDIGGTPFTTMRAGIPFKIIGINLSTTSAVTFSATIGGNDIDADADAVQIDSDTQLTVTPPSTFIPNAGQSVSSIRVVIFVTASGGMSPANMTIVAISL